MLLQVCLGGDLLLLEVLVRGPEPVRHLCLAVLEALPAPHATGHPVLPFPQIPGHRFEPGNENTFRT